MNKLISVLIYFAFLLKFKQWDQHIDQCMIDLYDSTKPCSDLKCEENRQYDEHIPHKTQKCKGIHSRGQDIIIEIDS